jgi:hypothetical protein
MASRLIRTTAVEAVERIAARFAIEPEINASAWRLAPSQGLPNWKEVAAPSVSICHTSNSGGIVRVRTLTGHRPGRKHQ